jgi:hypothetical protein
MAGKASKIYLLISNSKKWQEPNNKADLLKSWNWRGTSLPAENTGRSQHGIK